MRTPQNLDLSRGERFGAALTVALIVACFGLVAPGGARAAGSGYYVTFVARSCPAYTDIFANKARNDIQESLKDLGPDSPYTEVDALVNPAIESSAPQSACSSLPGWQFTLGTGYQSRSVSGPWGSLSKVTDPFPRSIVTQDSTPLYDQHHSQIGSEQIAGATTIELTDAERQRASSRSQLWAQGGTPDDPVLAETHPGPQFGFGALRCAPDDLNGDNVEYIYFPAGENPSFPFNGSLSFDPNGFTLGDGQSQDFDRAGGNTWDVTEGAVQDFKLESAARRRSVAVGVDAGHVLAGDALPPGVYTIAEHTPRTDTGRWHTVRVVCNGRPRRPTHAIHVLIRRGHTTSCAFVNAFVAAGSISLSKISTGATGTVSFLIGARTGPPAQYLLHATTTAEGVAAGCHARLAD